MLHLNALILSRVQFAFTVSFHIIFPALSIGLASFLMVLEGLWLKTGHVVYRNLYKFWVKMFAISFGLGVVSGVVMSYQFGTNWSVFSDIVGGVIGPLLGFEVLTAFFLESSFLGIMLFGWGRVSPRLHWLATSIVAFGTVLSAFWILSVNSWMQTPAGFTIMPNGLFEPTNWLSVVFNASFPYRFVHMLMGAYLTTAFFVGGIGALILLYNKKSLAAQVMLAMSTLMAAIVTPLQILAGDMHGLNSLEHQPLKVAAMEGLWDTEKGAGLRVVAWPNQAQERNDFEVVIPHLSSLILTHSWDGEVLGLKHWPKEDRPPVMIVFWAFRIMVGIGFLMLGLGAVSAAAYFFKKLYSWSWLHRCWVLMTPAGFAAILSGWFVTEVGRQPFLVYGYLRTRDMLTPSLATAEVGWSLLSFFVVYSFVFGAGIFYMGKLIRKKLLQEIDGQTTQEVLS